MRFHRRQLEIAVQCLEEVQKKPAGVFYLIRRSLLRSWGYKKRVINNVYLQALIHQIYNYTQLDPKKFPILYVHHHEFQQF